MDIKKGFTLIELVIVIVILGILAAFIVPRFAGLSKEARIGTVSSMDGALRSASTIVHSKALTNNVAGLNSSSVTMEGNTTVDIAYGYPTGTVTGMGAALQSTSGFTPAYTTAKSTFDKDGAPATATEKCQAVYTAATATTVPPTFATDITGC